MTAHAFALDIIANAESGGGTQFAGTDVLELARAYVDECDEYSKHKEAAQNMARRYSQQVNETPALLSVLYDVDLMPEQIVLPVNAVRLSLVCEMFKRLSPESVTELFHFPSPPSEGRDV